MFRQNVVDDVVMMSSWKVKLSTFWSARNSRWDT